MHLQYLLKKHTHIHISEPMQFKPLSFKGQLYESCTYIIPWNAYKNLNITAEETEAESGY